MNAQDKRLAKNVGCDAERFGQIFAKAQALVSSKATIMLNAVYNTAKPSQFIGYGFQHARVNGWLEVLCTQCLTDGVVNLKFIDDAVQATNSEGLVKLQALCNSEDFKDTALYASGLLRAADFICRIEIDGKHRGTGFLVRPDVVMTAGHVISAPAGERAILGSAGNATPNSAARIKVIFDDKRCLVNNAIQIKPRILEVASKWLLDCSTPIMHGEKWVALKNSTPDYALIRLASAAVIQPQTLSVATAHALLDAPLIVIQHPEGGRMCHVDGASGISVAAYPEFFQHHANTLPGSSGAPCLNRQFQVVGIHTGELTGAATPTNIAMKSTIPFENLEKLPANTVPYAPDRFFDENGSLRPILGSRSETQYWLNQTLDVEKSIKRILVVAPVECSGCGMSFTANMIQGQLPADQHWMIRMHASQFSLLSPIEFATELLTQVGMRSLLLKQGLRELLSEGESTDVSWQRIHLWPYVLGKMNDYREGKMIWLVLDGLGPMVSLSRPLCDFLDLLYEQVIRHSWLRILLLGYNGDRPESAKAYMSDITLPKIDRQMVEAYYDRIEIEQNPALRAQYKQDFTFLLDAVSSAPSSELLKGYAKLIAMHLRVPSA
jgi:hypothetical protein